MSPPEATKPVIFFRISHDDGNHDNDDDNDDNDDDNDGGGGKTKLMVIALRGRMEPFALPLYRLANVVLSVYLLVSVCV